MQGACGFFTYPGKVKVGTGLKKEMEYIENYCKRPSYTLFNTFVEHMEGFGKETEIPQHLDEIIKNKRHIVFNHHDIKLMSLPYHDKLPYISSECYANDCPRDGYHHYFENPQLHGYTLVGYNTGFYTYRKFMIYMTRWIK